MLNLETIKDHLLNHAVVYALTVVISCGLAWLCYGFLYVLGKHTVIAKEKRKYFFLLASIVLFFSITMYERMDRQLEDIRSGASHPGGLHAGVIWVGRIDDSQFKYITNAIPSTNDVFTMSSISTSPGNAQIGKGVNYVVILRVDNSGEQSVAWGWKASLVLPGGSKLSGFIPSVGGVDGTVPTVIGPIRMRLENNLLQSLSESPLARGTAKVGWLPIHFNGLNELPNGSVIQITFIDVFGHEVKVEHVWGPPFG